MNGLTRSFAAAYGPKVRVNRLWQAFLTDIADAWDMEAFNERARNSIPTQRGGQPDEVVAGALYFAGEGAGFTTGAILAIDGGARLPERIDPVNSSIRRLFLKSDFAG